MRHLARGASKALWIYCAAIAIVCERLDKYSKGGRR